MRAWIAGCGCYLHFTNYKAGWGMPRRSTGFVEDIVANGARCFLNVGFDPEGDFGKLRELFQHHGYRCNKKRVRGDVSIPAVVLLDCAGLAVQQGYDGKFHLQVNGPIGSERVIGWFPFGPEMSDEVFVSEVERRQSDWALREHRI